jgi:hypothetical protein
MAEEALVDGPPDHRLQGGAIGFVGVCCHAPLEEGGAETGEGGELAVLLACRKHGEPLFYSRLNPQGQLYGAPFVAVGLL